MSLLKLDPDELLTTTRAVRKRLDFDRPVERSVIEECLRIALQAPTGGNRQQWHFVVVTDPAKRRAIADLYRKGWAFYLTSPTAAPNLHYDDPTREAVQRRVGDSAQYLADNLERVPVFLIPCFAGRIDGQPASVQAGAWGSLLPAVWSFMLAARARGLGTAWTMLHMRHEREVAEILGIPYEQFTQGALIPVPTRGAPISNQRIESRWRTSCTGTAGRPARHYAAAMALAGELGSRPLVARCHLGLGQLHRRAAPAAAREHLTSAIALLRELRDRFSDTSN